MNKKLFLVALMASAIGFSNSAYASSRVVVNAGETKSIISETISGLTSTEHGGAIFNKGELTVKNSSFDNNQGTTNYVLGGAIFNGGNATISDTEFTNNTSSFGAAIYNQTNLTVENSKFIGNSIHHHNDAWDSGAAIDNNDGCNVVLNVINSHFEGNKNSSLNGGGAIYFGSMSSEQSKIVGSTFIKNDSSYRKTVTDTNTGKGGAIGMYNGNLLVEKSTFTENKADEGGAILLREVGGASITIKDSSFNTNTATKNGGGLFFGDSSTGLIENVIMDKNEAVLGGAIYNASNITIDNLTATNNKATSNSGMGGAMYIIGTDGTQSTKITNSTFDGNSSDYVSGAIWLGANAKLDIEKGKFLNNKATYGGAIYTSNNNNNLTINNSEFTNNTADGTGAIGIYSNAEIKNTIFSGNKSTSDSSGGGGAISLGSLSKTSLENVTFENNTSASVGGAIATRDNVQGDNAGATLDINGATFTNNTASGNGGAIYNAFFNDENGSGAISINNAIFDGNSSGSNGGAIYNELKATTNDKNAAINITDASFTNNTAADKGGAIFGTGDINISAQNSNVNFSGNSAGDGGDIYMQKVAGQEMGKISIQTNDEEKTVTFGSGISGSEKFKVNATGSGNLVLDSYIKNADMLIDDTTLILGANSNINSTNTIKMQNNADLVTANNKIDDLPQGILTIDGTVGLTADIDLATGEGDNIGEALNQIASTGQLRLDAIAPIGNTTENNISFDIYDALGLNQNQMQIVNPQNIYTPDVMTPIRYLRGSVDESGMVAYAPRGNGYSDFNPAVMTGAVAAQAGGYLAQLNTYNQAFLNLDMKMLMTREEREVMRMRNRYATTEKPQVFSPTYLPEEQKAMWIRPYSSFESINMSNGPKVSNVAYGTYFGGDSEVYELNNGAMAQISAYAGYNGSHQAYAGNSIYQNGGTIGLTGIVYKDNFFTALTANTGASVADASTMYGGEDIPMLMAGVASKTGYNWELARGKFIVQPSFMMSYTFVNTFDYTNAAGIKIQSSPLHAIQIAPGVKFIGNLKNSWQPYINLRMVWNVMDKTDITAANVSLPDMSVKPYFEYGVGVQKRWGERFTGFGQVMLKAGGIKGASLGCGFRWALGKPPVKSYNPPKAKNLVQTTSVKLSNIK